MQETQHSIKRWRPAIAALIPLSALLRRRSPVPVPVPVLVPVPVRDPERLLPVLLMELLLLLLLLEFRVPVPELMSVPLKMRASFGGTLAPCGGSAVRSLNPV